MTKKKITNEKNYENHVGLGDDVRTLCVCCETVYTEYCNTKCGKTTIHTCKMDNIRVNTYGTCRHQKMREECADWD